MCILFDKNDLQIKFANMLVFKSKCSYMKQTIYHLKDEVFTQRFRHSIIRKFCLMLIRTAELHHFCELKNQIKFSNAFWYHECCLIVVNPSLIFHSTYYISILMLILRIVRTTLNDYSHIGSFPSYLILIMQLTF